MGCLTSVAIGSVMNNSLRRSGKNASTVKSVLYTLTNSNTKTHALIKIFTDH